MTDDQPIAVAGHFPHLPATPGPQFDSTMCPYPLRNGVCARRVGTEGDKFCAQHARESLRVRAME